MRMKIGALVIVVVLLWFAGLMKILTSERSISLYLQAVDLPRKVLVPSVRK